MADWIISTITATGYWGIFLLMLLESIFPPIPSELIVPFAGFAVERGELNLIGVLAATTAGAVIGTLPWYFAGRLLGLHRTKWLADKFGRWLAMNSDEIDVASAWFLRYGPAIVFLGRLLPIIRTVISVPAGIAAMPLPAFLAASATFRAPSTWTACILRPNTPTRFTAALAPSTARATLSGSVMSALTKPNWPTWPSGWMK